MSQRNNHGRRIGIDECDHDFRINPFLILTTHPPTRQLVCVECGQTRNSYDKSIVNLSEDPKTWAKANV